MVIFLGLYKWKYCQFFAFFEERVSFFLSYVISYEIDDMESIGALVGAIVDPEIEPLSRKGGRVDIPLQRQKVLQTALRPLCCECQIPWLKPTLEVQIALLLGGGVSGLN